METTARMSTRTENAASYASQQDVLSMPDAGPRSRPDGDPADADGAEAMLATMADEAIDRLLAGDEARGAPPAAAAEDSGPLLSEAERAALAAPVEAERDEEVVPASTKPPAWARPLVWADRPFAGVPGPVREAAGKIALVTLLNAAAVFAYLVLTR